jgi:hypothetical protein
MTTNTYDTIIWGPSLNGITKAIELKHSGQKVLLAGKFGFPGGNASEALASLLSIKTLQSDPVLASILDKARLMSNAILFENAQWVMFHPEAIKRLCWETINENELDVLFHIIPLKIEHNPLQLEVFGREGKFFIQTDEIIDMSDDQYLSSLNGTSSRKNLVINSFFSNPLPPDLPGFHIIRRFETNIGQYVSISIKNVDKADIEHTFNRELDRLSIESWKKFNARILMVPVYPEILPA